MACYTHHMTEVDRVAVERVGERKAMVGELVGSSVDQQDGCVVSTV